MSPGSPGGLVHSAPGVWKGPFQTLMGGSSTSTYPKAGSLAGSSCHLILIPTIREMAGAGGGSTGVCVDCRNHGKVQAISEVCQRSRKP